MLWNKCVKSLVHFHIAPYVIITCQFYKHSQWHHIRWYTYGSLFCYTSISPLKQKSSSDSPNSKHFLNMMPPLLFGSQRNSSTSRVEGQHPLFTMRALWTLSSLPQISQQQRLALNILTINVYYWPSVLIVIHYFNFTQLVLLFFFGMAVPGLTI